MKKIILFLFFLAIAGHVAGQLRLGIKGGISTTNLEPEDLNLLGQDGVEKFVLALKDAKLGAHAGLIFNVKLGKFMIQPELNFNSNKVDYEITDVNNPGTITGLKSEKYQYLDIPLLFGVKFGPIHFQGGPEGHLYISSSSDLEELEGYDRDFELLSYGWIAGIGLNIWNVVIDFRFDGYFDNFGNHIEFENRPYEFNESQTRFLLSAGILFGAN